MKHKTQFGFMQRALASMPTREILSDCFPAAINIFCSAAAAGRVGEQIAQAKHTAKTTRLLLNTGQAKAAYNQPSRFSRLTFHCSLCRRTQCWHCWPSRQLANATRVTDHCQADLGSTARSRLAMFHINKCSLIVRLHDNVAFTSWCPHNAYIHLIQIWRQS